MSNNSSGYNGSNTNKTNTWSARLWFVLFGGALILWAALYLYSHSYMGITGYKVTRFSSADVRNVNSILISDNTNFQLQNSYQPIRKAPVTNSNDGFLDSYPTDSQAAKTAYITEVPQAYINNFSEEEQRKERTRKAMIYITTQYGGEISSSQLHNIRQYISNFSARETGVFLADYRLKVKSYFWLSGVMVYAEVIFWVTFGVLCSLLLYAGNATRKRRNNTQRDILYHAARLFYAPFAAIILVLIYSYVKGGSSINIETGEGIIIFAFLLGLLSGIAQDIADRLRGSNNTQLLDNNEINTPVQKSMREAYLAEAKQQPVAQQPKRVDLPTEQEDVLVGEDTLETENIIHKEVTKDRKKILNEDNEIAEVQIDLKLDFSGLFDDERNQLHRLGFSRAIVTLHNVNGKDIIPAKKSQDDTTTFIAADVKPGIYIARATLSQRLRDDQIINLFGEKTAYITEDKPGLELYVKKYEAAD